MRDASSKHSLLIVFSKTQTFFSLVYHIRDVSLGFNILHLPSGILEALWTTPLLLDRQELKILLDSLSCVPENSHIS